MNSLFGTFYSFTNYSAEHFAVLLFFLVFSILFIRKVKTYDEAKQQRILLYGVIFISLVQLAKIPLNLYTGKFDVTADIPLHLCNFLPFVLIWVYTQKNRNVWAIIFFWVMLGCSQANFTPSIDQSLFYYDALRYWLVHALLVLFTLYPAIAWNWEITQRDVWKTLLWLNIVAAIIYVINIILGSNYLYIMEKPPGTNFYSILPEWPYYLLSLEFIVLALAYILLAIFKLIKKKSPNPQLLHNT